MRSVDAYYLSFLYSSILDDLSFAFCQYSEMHPSNIKTQTGHKHPVSITQGGEVLNSIVDTPARNPRATAAGTQSLRQDYRAIPHRQPD
jgi:hypothetical protein